MAKGEGGSPEPKISVEGIVLFFEHSVAGFEVLGGMESPVLIEAKVEAAGDKVLSEVESKIVVLVEIAVPEGPAPEGVRREGDVVIGLRKAVLN